MERQRLKAPALDRARLDALERLRASAEALVPALVRRLAMKGARATSERLARAAGDATTLKRAVRDTLDERTGTEWEHPWAHAGCTSLNAACAALVSGRGEVKRIETTAKRCALARAMLLEDHALVLVRKRTGEPATLRIEEGPAGTERALRHLGAADVWLVNAPTPVQLARLHEGGYG